MITRRSLIAGTAAIIATSSVAAAGSKIVFAGDSVTYAVTYGGVTTTDTFAYKVGIANGYAAADIINAGVSRNTSVDLLARLATDVIAPGPAVAVIEIGINDWYLGVPIATFQSNIATIFTNLKAASIKPVGMSKMHRGSTVDFSGQNAFWQVFEQEAEAANVPVIDLYREECASYLYLSNTDFYANYVDAVHFTIAGHQFVTDLCARPTHAGLFT